MGKIGLFLVKLLLLKNEGLNNILRVFPAVLKATKRAGNLPISKLLLPKMTFGY